MNSFFTQMGAAGGIVVMLLIALTFILIIINVILTMNVGKLNRRYNLFMKDDNGRSLEREFGDRFALLEKLGETSENHAYDIGVIKATLDRSLNKYGIVKYDAFEDVGGRLSFALALLDKSNSGFVLNAIHSRENCFLYIKEIVNGESYIVLSEEEVEALRVAVNSGIDLESNRVM